jgi:hypothetical protein
MWTALLGPDVIDLESMTPADKLTLRQEAPDFKCRGCKGPVHTRHVPDGDDTDPFLVFVHNPGAAEECRRLGFHTDESDAHHRLKAYLAAGARRAGWTAELEVHGDRCRADVVATKGTETRVFEAQISPLSVVDAVERTRRYQSSIGDPVWVHTRRRDWSKRVPSVHVETDDDALTAPLVVGGVMIDQAGTIPAPTTPLRVVVPRILVKDLKYLYDPREQFGFFLDLAAASSSTHRPRRSNNSPAPRGAYVSDTCSRPSVAADSFGHDPSDRKPCDWCGQFTARRSADGQPRHGWCEVDRGHLWSGMARPPKGR